MSFMISSIWPCDPDGRDPAVLNGYRHGEVSDVGKAGAGVDAVRHAGQLEVFDRVDLVSVFYSGTFLYRIELM
jgi:hypothetical protein